MILKTSELKGPALDWAVATCEGNDAVQIKAGGPVHLRRTVGCSPTAYTPSTDWAQGGPINEREKIGVWWDGTWHAKLDGCHPRQVQDDYEPLIAAMRCYVASKLGDEVEVPDELGELTL